MLSTPSKFPKDESEKRRPKAVASTFDLCYRAALMAALAFSYAN
jgi:hypothetical protein